jgi:hypothetical protein
LRSTLSRFQFRLKTATLKQIAKVPGFGGKAAEELKTFLEAQTI